MSFRLHGARMDRRLLVTGFLVLFALAALLTLAPLPAFPLVVGANSRIYGAALLALFLMVAAVLGGDLRERF